MKKQLMGLAILAASGSSLATEVYSGRLSGMAGAGYATGHYSDGVLLNPSLLASYGEKDDFAVVLNLGALGIEKNDMKDNIDDLTDLIDEINATSDDLSQSQATRLMALLHSIDGSYIRGTPGASLTIALPNKLLSAALVYKATGSANLITHIDDSDFPLIEGNINQWFDPENLSSTLAAHAVLVQEVGISLARNISPSDDYQLLLGITPKHVEVDTFIYRPTVEDYNEDDLDEDDYIVTGKTNNLIDAGITLINGPLRYALSVNNINSHSFKTIEPGVNYTLDTKATFALGYTGSRYKAEVALDLNKVGVFGIGDSQMLRAGVEVSAARWLQLRLGVQTDLEDSLPKAY